MVNKINGQNPNPYVSFSKSAKFFDLSFEFFVVSYSVAIFALYAIFFGDLNLLLRVKSNVRTKILKFLSVFPPVHRCIFADESFWLV